MTRLVELNVVSVTLGTRAAVSGDEIHHVLVGSEAAGLSSCLGVISLVVISTTLILVRRLQRSQASAVSVMIFRRAPVDEEVYVSFYTRSKQAVYSEVLI